MPAMMVYLIRHAMHDLVGRVLSGRTDVGLSDEGRRQSVKLADRFEGIPLAAIYSSPLRRARETAAPLAERAGIGVMVSSALQEFDFGEWTGREIASMGDDPAWKRFNSLRSRSRAPGGESMLDVQARIVGFLEELHDRGEDGSVAVVSHGDVLKAAVLHYLGMPLDSFLRLEIGPASVSVLELAPWGARVLAINDTGAARERR